MLIIPLIFGTVPRYEIQYQRLLGIQNNVFPVPSSTLILVQNKPNLWYETSIFMVRTRVLVSLNKIFGDIIKLLFTHNLMSVPKIVDFVPLSNS